MAAINSVQGGLRLPLTGLTPNRVLMCSASMGAEGSVTLQLREAVQAPDAGQPIDGALTIGYPDPEILADMLGSLQAAGTDDGTSLVRTENNESDLAGFLFAKTTSKCSSVQPTAASSSNNNNNNNNNSNNNNNNNIANAISTNSTVSEVITRTVVPSTTQTTTNTSANTNNNSSSSNNNNNNNTIINGNIINSVNNSKNNSNNNKNNNNGNNNIINGNNNNINSVNNNNISNNNNIKNSNNTTSSSNNNNASTVTAIKKPRTKTASPTRHGPQQCQVCNKIFGNASALAKHKLTHSDERKYVCSMCSKAFKRQDHLNGHMLTHRNKKPYECKAEGCGKSYCDARSLRRHTENHHSGLAMTPTTPNQSMSSSTGPPTGLSLSPATASGDASSPHGATCIQYNSNSGSNSGDGSSPKPLSPSSPAGAGNEGLTRQQLDLITQIMQQTKQANAGIAAAVAAAAAAAGNTNNGGTGGSGSSSSANNNTSQRHVQRPRTWNMQTQLQQTQTKISPNSDNQTAGTILTSLTTINGAKVEQKPVECNLCHRKFKNIPALNGHMRLHGGYFKKDSETKKCDKKETPGPPLQTASVGVRALIEEKIINKRSKDLKGAFVVPAPPLAARRLLDAENYISPKISTASNGTVQATIITSNSITAPKTNQHNGTIQLATSQNGSTNQKTLITSSTASIVSSIGTSTMIENSKDATLIELLKRGTKVAVKRACSDPGQVTYSSLSKSQSTTTTMVIPTTTTATISTLANTTSAPPLALSLSSGGENTPLALTISQSPSGSGDVYTLAYSTDSTTAFFTENDVYNVPDAAMLLQAVDSIQLLHDSSTSDHMEEIASLSDYTLNGSNGNLTENISQSFTPSRQLQAVLDSPLPESLAEFSALHSKDYVLYGCSSTDSPTTQSSASPLPSPLAYPTPPASHETVAQASPFLDDSHHFSDPGSLFDDKKSHCFFDDSSRSFFKDSKEHLSESQRILKLKNELFNETKSVMDDSNGFFKDEKNLFCVENPVSLLEENSVRIGGLNVNRRMQEFNHQNLSFLDEPQNFLEDARNTSSPLSAAFFSATMSSAEEVKEALEEVLPNENMHAEDAADNDIDLYYLPGLSLQSQMMPNSDDPLLSSSPKDFPQKTALNKFDFSVFCPPSSKKSKTFSTDSELSNPTANSTDSNKFPLTIQTVDQISKNSEVFLSPNSLSSTSSTLATSTPSPKTLSASVLLRKRPHNEINRNYQQYKSRLRKSTTAQHYVPPPLLNPERMASGLYATVIKFEENDIIDYVNDIDTTSTMFFNRPKINIGSDYQAVIPPALSSADDPFDCDLLPHDSLQWDPSVINDNKQLQRFVELSKSSAVPLGCHSEEIALKTLMESQGEVHVAVLKLLQAPPSTALHKRWSSNEMETFLKGLENCGKDFFRIAKLIPSKTTGDCIQLYYFWKKICVDYKTTHLRSEIDHALSSLTNFDVTNTSPSVQPQTQLPIQHNHHSEPRPHVCEMPDCSASFTSKAALHGHTRIHCIGRSLNLSNHNNNHAILINNSKSPTRIIINNKNNHNIAISSNTNNNNNINNNSNSSSNNNNNNSLSGPDGNVTFKDDFPCKVCGKIFNKIRSRSAHMKSHRPQDVEVSSSLT